MKKFVYSIITVFIIFCNIDVYAYNFEVDGIRYSVKDTNKKEVSVVVNSSNENEDITIPSTVRYLRESYVVRYIDTRAFHGSKRLRSIKLPNTITRINLGAFKDCISLSSINLPDSLEIIGAEAFFNCSSLKKITIPQYVNSISNGAFKKCSNLVEIISKITNPFSIYEDTFEGINSSAVLYIPLSTKEKYNQFAGWTKHFKTIEENNSIIDYLPITTIYTLTINISGNGSALLYGEFIRQESKKYNIVKDSRQYIRFLSDAGYTLKNVIVNGEKKESNGYLDFLATSDMTIDVEFEVNPNYTLNSHSESKSLITFAASGNGVIYTDGNIIRNGTKSFEYFRNGMVECEFIPDNGYQLKSYFVNGKSNSIISGNAGYGFSVPNNWNISVEFDKSPNVTSHFVTISAKGNGYVLYEGDHIKDSAKKYSICEGSNIIVPFLSEYGYKIKSLKVNGSDYSANSNSYIILINSDTSIEVEFGEMDKSLSYNGINYEISSFDEHKVILLDGNYGAVLEVPEQISLENQDWKVDGVKNNVMNSNELLTAIIWNPTSAFNASVDNPNLLLYVKDASYAPSSINNVIVNGFANKITLMESKNGNNFYCPQEFTAKSISYTHSYNMTTGINESRGWETIALPFDVQKITHASRGDLVPYSKWVNNGQTKPFWLYQLSDNGFVAADGIKAYTPYIISMPNNPNYLFEYRLNGSVTFSAENVKIAKSDNVQTATYKGRTFIPNFENRLSNNSIYALNVNNDYETFSGTEAEGGIFISNLRSIHPFEACMTSNSGTRSFGIFDNMTTAIDDITIMNEDDGSFKVYDLKGILIRNATSIDEAKKDLPAGIYIMNQKKIIIK